MPIAYACIRMPPSKDSFIQYLSVKTFCVQCIMNLGYTDQCTCIFRLSTVSLTKSQEIFYNLLKKRHK